MMVGISNFLSHTIHGNGIFTYIWLIFLVDPGFGMAYLRDPIPSEKDISADSPGFLKMVGISHFPFGMVYFQGLCWF